MLLCIVVTFISFNWKEIHNFLLTKVGYSRHLIITGTCPKCNKNIFSEKHKLKCSTFKFDLDYRYSHLNKQQNVNYTCGDFDFIC